MALVSALTMLITVRTHQLNGQLPDNPSCKDASSRQPASFCLKSTKKKHPFIGVYSRNKISWWFVLKKGKEMNISNFNRGIYVQ